MGGFRIYLPWGQVVTRYAPADHARPGWTELPVKESIRMPEDIDKWRKYVHGVANPRRNNRTEQIQQDSSTEGTRKAHESVLQIAAIRAVA